MNRKRSVDDLYEVVQPIGDADSFQRVIDAEQDDYVLADLRDRFWDGRGEKPWQVKEINRLLTRRKENRAASGAPTKSTSLKERIENNLILFFLGVLITGFMAGLGTFEGALKLIDYAPTSNDYLRKLKDDLEQKKEEVAALKATPKSPEGQTGQRWLRVRGVDGLDGVRARLVARVNGNAYSYPSRAVWAELGRGMTTEDFPLPIGVDDYKFSFELLTLSAKNQYRQFQSQEVLSVRTWPFEGEYKIFPVNISEAGPTRASGQPTDMVARILFEVR